MSLILQQISTPLGIAFLYWASDRFSKEKWGIEYHKAFSYLTLLILSVLVVIFIDPYQDILNSNKYVSLMTIVVSGLIVGEILSPLFDALFGNSFEN